MGVGIEGVGSCMVTAKYSVDGCISGHGTISVIRFGHRFFIYGVVLSEEPWIDYRVLTLDRVG